MRSLGRVLRRWLKGGSYSRLDLAITALAGFGAGLIYQIVTTLLWR